MDTGQAHRHTHLFPVGCECCWDQGRRGRGRGAGRELSRSGGRMASLRGQAPRISGGKGSRCEALSPAGVGAWE